MRKRPPRYLSLRREHCLLSELFFLYTTPPVCFQHPIIQPNTFRVRKTSVQKRIKKTIWPTWLLLFSISAIFAADCFLYESRPRVLRARIPLGFLRGASRLLEPKNLKFVGEYYLLENLGAGLVIENWRSPRIWVPSLAESWRQDSEHSWTFVLRKDLRWSDGSLMLPEHIIAHLSKMKRKTSRHLTALRSVEEIRYHEETHSLTLSSQAPLSDALLHELSLAELLILHPMNRKDDWSVTSGPYFIAEKGPDALQLEANPYYHRKPHIQSVRILDAFTGVNVRKRPFFSIREDLTAMARTYDQVLVGQPSIVYYFYFLDHSLSQDREFRRAFARFMRRAFETFRIGDSMNPIQQLIPSGYLGNLKEIPGYDEPLDVLRKHVLKICLNQETKDILGEHLTQFGRGLGIDVQISDASDKETLARQTVFLSNQRDPMSSWTYLFSEGGPLYTFYPKFAGIFADLAKASEWERKALYATLHRLTLEEALAVPFLVESDAILASHDVDLSDINPFDMRLRFFEMKWKKNRMQ